MYNIWCEIKSTLIILLIAFPLLLFSNIMENDLDLEFIGLLILYVLLLLTTLKIVLKYLSLKKNGVMKYNVPYRIMNKPKGKFLYVNYTDEQGVTTQLTKKDNEKKDRDILKTLPESGYTSMLINPKNKKEYYIFYPNNN